MKIAVLASHAPESIRNVVQNMSVILQFGRVFHKDSRGVESEPSSTNATSMDVDAVDKGNGKGWFVCGRPGHAAKDCKFDQGKGKGQSKGKTKTTTDKNSPAKFEGECRHCGKKSHKWADCRKRLAVAKDKKVHAVDGAPLSATVKAVEDTGEIDEAGICGSWSDDDDSGVDTSEDNMPADAAFFPLDSACEEHTCPWNFAEGARDLGPSNVQLKNANGYCTFRLLPCRATSKRPLLSVGKLTQSGAVQKSSSEAKAHGLIFTLSLECNVCLCDVRVKGKTLGLSIQKTDAWVIRETSDPAPHAAVAPVDEEIGRAEAPIPPTAAPEVAAAPRAEETQGVRLEREARDLAAVWQSSRQFGQPLGEGGLASSSNVDDMQNWLKALGAPVWSTKAQMWPRLVHAEARRELQKRDEAWLADRAKDHAEAGGQGELRVPRPPDEPSADERARHEVTHPPCQPWFAWCVMVKDRANPHLQRPVKSVKIPEFACRDVTLAIRRGPRPL